MNVDEIGRMLEATFGETRQVLRVEAMSKAFAKGSFSRIVGPAIYIPCFWPLLLCQAPCLSSRIKADREEHQHTIYALTNQEVIGIITPTDNDPHYYIKKDHIVPLDTILIASAEPQWFDSRAGNRPSQHVQLTTSMTEQRRGTGHSHQKVSVQKIVRLFVDDPASFAQDIKHTKSTSSTASVVRPLDPPPYQS